MLGRIQAYLIPTSWEGFQPRYSSLHGLAWWSESIRRTTGMWQSLGMVAGLQVGSGRKDELLLDPLLKHEVGEPFPEYMLVENPNALVGDSMSTELGPMNHASALKMGQPADSVKNWVPVLYHLTQ